VNEPDKGPLWDYCRWFSLALCGTAGHILLPKEASWLNTFLHELLAFPTGRHDDQVDSVSQFLKWASQRESVFDLTMISAEAKVFVGGVQIN
jgi:hypothetical protein